MSSEGLRSPPGVTIVRTNVRGGGKGQGDLAKVIRYPKVGKLQKNSVVQKFRLTLGKENLLNSGVAGKFEREYKYIKQGPAEAGCSAQDLRS